MLAYSYIRFSSPEQLKGDSLRRQLEKSEKYAAENNLTLNTSLSMRDLGLSAFDKSNIHKGALGSFLKAIEQGQVPRGSFLLVESLDRISRATVMDALQIFIDILNAGVNIVTLSDNQQYSKESIQNNFTQLIMSIVIMSRAHEESAMKSMRVGAAWKKKKKDVVESGKVLTKRTPHWITVKADKLVLIPDRAKVVKRMFEMARSGIGNYTIIKTLNAEVPAWSKSGKWQVSYVQKVLQNPALYGAIDIDGTLVEGYYPAIVSKDEFLFVSSERTARKSTERAGTRKGQGVSNLFSGILICGYCKSKMHMSGFVDNRFGTTKRGKYVACHGARTGATKCACIQWPYDEFEALFFFKVTALNLEAILGENTFDIRPMEENIARMRNEVDTTQTKINNLYIAIEEDPLPGLVKRLRELEAQLEVEKKSLADAERLLLVKRLGTDSAKDRIGLMLKLFRFQKTKSADELRIMRETLSEQIKMIVERIEMFPSGPILTRDKEARELRLAHVYFKSGSMLEISEG